MKDEEIKCNCGAETTGWTTIACCNLCGLPIPNEPFSVNKQMLVNRFERIVMFENCGDWRKERPGLPCLFATRTKLPSGIYHYNFYKLVEYQDSDNYYFAWCDLDGEEIDDIHNLEADEYLILIVGSNFST